MVLVEGFKQAAIPKIELYRASLGKPLMYPLDENIIAIAADSHLDDSGKEPLQLNLNKPEEIAEFIRETFLNLPIATSSCSTNAKVPDYAN